MQALVRADGSINHSAAFCHTLGIRRVLQLSSFEEFIEECDDAVTSFARGADMSVSQNALNNVHGRWFETLLAVGFWEYFHESGDCSLVLLDLPNRAAFDAISLYEQPIAELVEDLRSKVAAADNEVSLITSNPDFALLRRQAFQASEVPLPRGPGRVESEHLAQIEDLYSKYVGRCALGDIAGYWSVKTSLRPDRRLQWAHEGSLVKALFRHIQTRIWDFSTPAPRYVGITLNYNAADATALKTVATHSLVTVDTVPERAVDELFPAASGQGLVDSIVEFIDLSEVE